MQGGTPGEGMGTPWLRPWVFRRILRASKHSSKAAARACPSPLPAVLRKCYETSSIWFVLFAVALSRTRQSKSSISARMEHWNMEKTAGARGAGLAFCAVGKMLGALRILQKRQGRSQAAPLAASRQRTRCRDRPQPQRNSRMLRACLKNAFCQMYFTICGRFVPNEGRIAGYVT